MTKGGSSPVLVENGGNKMDGNGGNVTPVVKKRGFFSGSFRRRHNSDVKINDTIIINENVVFNGNNGKAAENGCKTPVVEPLHQQQYVVNDKKPPLQQKLQQQSTVNKKTAADKKSTVDTKKQVQQQADKKKSTAAPLVDDKKKAVTKRGNQKPNSNDNMVLSLKGKNLVV